MVADAVMLLLVSVCVVSVEKSATVPIAAGVSLVTAAVVILCREVVVKVAIPCHGLTSATREGGEGGTVAVLPIVEVLCHDEVGRSFDVCHGSSVQGQQWGMGVMVDSASIAHSRGDGDHVRRHVHPLDRCAAGHAPDRGGFGHLLGDPIRSVDGGGVVCPILVKVAEGGGLNCEHVQRCLIDLIIEAQRRPNAI